MDSTAQIQQSQFTGTPWKSDEEIYEFVLHRKNRMGLEWEDINKHLVKEGLDEEYAYAIIENLKNAEHGEYANNVKRIKRNRRLCQVIWAIIFFLVIMPIVYSLTVNYARIVSLMIYAIGFNGIKQSFANKISSLSD